MTASGQDIAPVPPLQPPFPEWLAALKEEALSRGIRPEIVDAALADVEAPVETVLERDRTQAEFTLQLDQYLKRRLTPRLIRSAQDLYTKQRTLLTNIGKKYGVSPRILVAVWGLESNFGRFAGVRPTIPALATLAYDPRRATFFRSELFAALEILNRGDIDLASLKGSWAGALGQPQFMPSSYLRYAQDYDGDGHRDIWNSPPDVFASVAYLPERARLVGAAAPGAARCWCRRRRAASVRGAGTRARVPRRTCDERAALPHRVEARRGSARSATGRSRPAPRTASLVSAGTRYFLVYDNYEAILAYNCAHTYALSVALLSDRLK